MSRWGVSPRQSVEAECQRRGRTSVVTGCIALLAGGIVDADLLLALAGPPAAAVMGGAAGGLEGYWPRVWGARGLLYAWEERAVPSIVAATGDESWRVREMALKVVARHELGEALEIAARLQDDPVPRVRAAANRALRRLVDAGA